MVNDVIEQKRTASLQKHTYFDLINDITTIYTSETNNVVVVKIYELSEQKRIEFKKAFPDIDCIVFKEGGINSTTYVWRPGNKLYDPNRKILSTGYPVYFTDSNGATQRGFITAGHTFDILGMNYNYAYRTGSIDASSKIAEKVRSQFSGSVDAALMRITDSDYQMTDITSYESVTLVTNSYLIVPEGTLVYKEGAATRSTQGEVLSLDGEVNYGTTVVSDLIVTSALNLPGDSGGVMYSAVSFGIIGSMSGSSRINANQPLTEDNFEESYVSAVANATNALNCSVWNY